MRPIVFLDIDGVLNTPREYSRWSAVHEGKAITPTTDVPGYSTHDEQLFGAEHVAHLNEITKATDAHIVLSSTWRFMYSGRPGQLGIEDFRDLFRRVGIAAHVTAFTPPEVYHRGEAIVAWLRANREGGEVGAAPFVILDDEPARSFPSALRRFVVNTDGAVGLRETHARRAITMLKGESK